MKCTMLKSVIRRFQGALMRCSKSVFGHFSANLPFSAILPKITSLNENGHNSAWNRLRTSHESSPKPPDHTLQHGALYFWLFHENGCVKCWILFFVIIGGFFAKWPTVHWFSVFLSQFTNFFETFVTTQTLSIGQWIGFIKWWFCIGIGHVYTTIWYCVSITCRTTYH